MTADLPILVATAYLDKVSETFIRAQIEGLPFRVTVLHGKPRPRWLDGRPLLGAAAIDRAVMLAHRWPTQQLVLRLLEHRLARRLRQGPWRVVLGQYGHDAAKLVSPCRRAGVPLVAHFHGADAFVADLWPSDRYRALFDHAAAIVAVSTDMRAQLIDLGAPSEKVWLNPCGVSLEAFRGGAPAQAPPLFVAVGRFVPKKHPLATIQAFAQVARQAPEARLVMIGEGELREPARQLVHELGLDAKVELPGALPHAQVQTHMRAARAFVQHSVRTGNGDAEGTPVSVLEAQATGLPVVATRHMGIKDVVVEGQTGLLCDEHDVDAMAAHMLRLARDSELAGQMGAVARQRVGEHFSQEARIAHLAHIIETVIDVA